MRRLVAVPQQGTKVALPAAVRTIFFLVVASRCVTTTTTATQRVAMATTPGAPQALSTSGMGLAMRMIAGPPRASAEGGAVAYAQYQPEFGALLRVRDSSFASFKLAVASASFGASNPTSVPLSGDALVVDLTGGFGHDVKFSPLLGVTVSGEVGFATVALLERAGNFVQSSPVVMLSGRAAGAIYAEPGPVRIWLGGSLGTGTWNDFSSVRTTTCGGCNLNLTGGCDTTNTGDLTVSAVGMVGAGVRWQPAPSFSAGLEAWMPLSNVATQFPPMVALTIRVGDFSVNQRSRPSASPVQPQWSPPPVIELPPPQPPVPPL